jgi:phosphohistidine phosphatase SixA
MNARFSLWQLLLTSLLALAVTPRTQGQTQARPQAKAKPPVTTVYLVRHAEKDSVAGSQDPELSALGQRRAQALRTQLAKRKPVALFTTDTKRTRATLAPLATALAIEPQVYDGADVNGMAARIRKEYPGQAVVVVGHSNTLLPLIDALGGIAPVEEIAETDYDYLFTVRLSEDTEPTVGMRGYGPQQRLPASERQPISLPKLGKPGKAAKPAKPGK